MSENMKIWEALKTTDPKFTKPVTFGRKFTSINSQYQLQRMTEQFGPVGRGWGYDVAHSIERITDEYVLAIADVTIWTGLEDSGVRKGDTSFGPVRGMSPIVEKTKNGLHFDDDAGKKAMTDALTKGLSHLGLSADVFLGLFDDNKYVREVAQQFADKPETPSIPEEDKGLLTKQHGETSQYNVDKRKAAEKFVNEAIVRFASIDSQALHDWYKEPTSPKGRSTNRDAVTRLSETFPDLYDKLETAADAVGMK